jgi:hypothetical protein
MTKPDKQQDQKPDDDAIDRSPEATEEANRELREIAKGSIPEDERPDEAKRRERPDAVPPRSGTAKQIQGYTDLAREREAELPPEKRKEP